MSDIYASNTRMLGFSLPALGLNSLLVSVFVFLPTLYAEQGGLDAATVGLIFLLAKLVDMFVAPTCGVLMDSYTTRWGRRRPWLAASVPILVLAVLMVYNPPETASGLYLFFSLALLYVGFNAWSISHTSWALELSRDYDRRSRITGLLQVMVMIGGIMMSLVPAVLERFAAPTYPELVSSIGWFLIILLPLTAVLAIFSLPERESANRPRLGLKRGAAIVFKNMALLRLLIVNALLTFSTYFVQGLFVFFVSYSLGLEDRIGFILGFLIVGGLIGLPVWLRIAQTWNKHRAMQIAVSTGAIAPLVLLALPPGYLLLTVAAFLVVGLNTSANEFLPRTMMADVCDQDHVESGSERMGLYYSLLQLSSKLASGGAIFIGFSFLAVFGFDPELGLNNTEEALQRLRYLIVALPVLAYSIVIALLLGYPISREKQQEMREIIEKREAVAGQVQ